ncbi:hypothetical protein [Streptomyces sulphureus]|uniref:hypothetical protein n=1 Tax=Streptomyces sulphureus TaxID=47758 RepID=UPI0003633348|nr:hypothetical protein [Streptomyces sulphureus]
MTPRLPRFADRLCDDAAVFPPGSLPLEAAVPAHRRHCDAVYAGLVGPLVLAAPSLEKLRPLLDGGEPLALVITAPQGPGQLAGALRVADGLPVTVAGVEVAVGGDADVPAYFADLARVTSGLPASSVYVEVPRDWRRDEVLAGCAAAGHRAKFRTGGVEAALYPDVDELASSVAAATAAGVPFKATAGLHHAVRNTDPVTGFAQHGFLNLLLAAERAAAGADREELAGVLAERAAEAVAAQVAVLAADPERTRAARAWFLSFGTCSITEPLAELVELGLVPTEFARPAGGSTERGATP